MQPYNLRNRIRDQSDPPLVIIPVTLADPAIVEIVGFAGAEVILIDAEHGMIGPETARSMLAHARSAGIPAVFRPLRFDAAVCRQLLDAGAAGIHVSHIDTEGEAAAVVRACRYPPLGRREMSLGRGIDYDFSSLHSYLARANDCQLLVVMIESLEGLANAEKIAAVPGIDVIHMGLADLAHDMGLSGQYDHPKVRAAVDCVLEATKPHNVAVGYPIADPRNISEWAAKGIRYFEGEAPDYLLRDTYAARLAAIREALGRLPKFNRSR